MRAAGWWVYCVLAPSSSLVDATTDQCSVPLKTAEANALHTRISVTFPLVQNNSDRLAGCGHAAEFNLEITLCMREIAFAGAVIWELVQIGREVGNFEREALILAISAKRCRRRFVISLLWSWYMPTPFFVISEFSCGLVIKGFSWLSPAFSSVESASNKISLFCDLRSSKYLWRVKEPSSYAESSVYF